MYSGMNHSRLMTGTTGWKPCWRLAPWAVMVRSGAATDAAGCAVALKFINAEAMAQVDPSLRGHWRAHLEREIVFLTGLDADEIPPHRHPDRRRAGGRPAGAGDGRLRADLGQWLAQQRRGSGAAADLAQVLGWAEQILDGLEVVHQAGFVYGI